MKKTIIAALCAAQLTATSVLGAELPGDPGALRASQVGAFGGARVRVPLGATREKPRVGLALTSTLRSGPQGQLRFAKGMELGFAGDEKLRLSLAGTPVTRLAPGGPGPNGTKAGVSTLGWVAIGVGTVVLVVLALGAICTPSTKCIDDGDG